MAAVQAQFVQFHEAIQLENLDDNKTLREKRDQLLEKLRSGLAKKFAGEKVPSFQDRNQGSYAMGTGVKPTEGRDFDIDVALLFNVDPDEVGPVEVKEWVHEILNVHPHSSVIRRPCVTVQYTEKGEDAYHLDFAVYAAPAETRLVPLLAKGFPGSEAKNKVWEASDFEGLLAALGGRFADEHDHLQYRRVIRYLKRWKDFQFKVDGEAAPRGIGLTCAAYLWFQPRYVVDPVSRQRKYDDLTALTDLANAMLARFTPPGASSRLRTPLPAVPGDDPFERMSDKQMQAFKSKLETLRDVLVRAAERADPVEACRDLRQVFGDDFPIPDKKSSSVASAGPAVVSTGHYA